MTEPAGAAEEQMRVEEEVKAKEEEEGKEGEDAEEEEEEVGEGADDTDAGDTGSAHLRRLWLWVRLRSFLEGTRGLAFLVFAFTWSLFFLFKFYLFSLPFPLGTDPAEHVLWASNIDSFDSLSHYDFNYPYGYHIMMVNFNEMSGIPYFASIGLQMVIGYMFIYMATIVLGITLFRNVFHANVLAMFMVFAPDVFRFLDWGGITILNSTGLLLVCFSLMLSQAKAGHRMALGLFLFLLAWAMMLSHVTSVGYLIVLVGLIGTMVFISPTGDKKDLGLCGAVVGGIILGSFFMTGKMSNALDISMDVLMDWKFIVLVAVAAGWAVFLYVRRNDVWGPVKAKIGPRWMVFLFVALLAVYAFDVLVVERFDNMARAMKDLIEPRQLVGEYGLLPLLAGVGLFFLIKWYCFDRARVGTGSQASGGGMGNEHFLFMFLLFAVCYGYVFFGLALYSTTHIKFPYTEAQRWLILANIPLVVFAVSGLRAVFVPRRRGLLKVGAAIVVIGIFGFAQFANSHSIEYTLYQSDDIADAIVYARWTAPENKSNLVTTHEGLWLAVLLDYDEIHNEWDEIYFKKTRGFNNSMPPISGTVFLTKRPHGTIPWTDSITQRMYIFNETGKYPDNSTRYMQHKMFENDNVWITENI